MRLTMRSSSARSRLLSCLLTLMLVAVPLGAYAAGAANNDATVEVSYDDVDEPTVSSGAPPPGETDYIDGEDNGDPVDVDYMTGLQLFLMALRTFR